MIKNISLFSLATTYPNSEKSHKPKFVHLLNKELSNLGYDVEVIVPHVKGFLEKLTLNSINIHFFRYLPEKLELNNLSIPDELKKSKFNYLKIVILFTSFFFFTFRLAIKKNPDFFHGHWAFPTGVIAVILALLFKKKSLITSHYAEIPLIKKSKFLIKITSYFLNRATHIVAVSSFTKQELINLGIHAEKISIIKSTPNFISNNYSSEELILFKKTHFDLSDTLILFVGRLVENKGIKYLIEAIPKVSKKTLQLVIVGNGPLSIELQDLCKSLNLSNRVTFFQKIDDKDLAMIRTLSDIFILPSIIDSRGITEGLGLVIPEAMYSGLPVIASSVGGIPDIITHMKNGLLVPQKNSTSIAESIDLLLENPDLKNKIIRNSQKTLQEFMSSYIAQQYDTLIKKINCL